MKERGQRLTYTVKERDQEVNIYGKVETNQMYSSYKYTQVM